MVKTGLDVAVEWLRNAPGSGPSREIASLLRGGRLGLLTNTSATTADLTAAPDALRAAGAHLMTLFGPEHGVRGDAPDGEKIPHGKDPHTGLPVWSLYGAETVPTTEMLQGLDAIVFDIQDVGSRFYTFESSLSRIMEGAARNRIPVIVLDRPNPIGGVALEGPILEPAHATFVGLHPIPIRHGATMGELGQLWSKFGAGPPPLVVRCQGWRRSQLWAQTGLSWVNPSPNMPSAETALLYPGACLLEGTNVSEARGTTGPFRWFGAPWIDAEALAERLNGAGLPGVRFRPVRFRPSASKFMGEACAGCETHILDPQAIRPVATGVAILSALRVAYPDRFAWRQNGGRYAVDRLAGTSRLRAEIDAGRTWKEISATWAEGIDGYRSELHRASLYG